MYQRGCQKQQECGYSAVWYDDQQRSPDVRPCGAMSSHVGRDLRGRLFYCFLKMTLEASCRRLKACGIGPD